MSSRALSRLYLFSASLTILLALAVASHSVSLAAPGRERRVEVTFRIHLQAQQSFRLGRLCRWRPAPQHSAGAISRASRRRQLQRRDFKVFATRNA